MNVKSIEKEGSKAKVVVEVEAELLESGKQKAYLKARKNIMVPGFRKGKCPRQMIEAMYGADVFTEDGINEIFPEVYAGTVLKEENLKPVGMPTVVDMQFPEAGGVELTVETELYPEVTLGDYKGLEIPKAEATVSDDEIAAELNRMAENVARVTTVERAAKDGDIAVIDFEGFDNGVSFDGGKGEDYELELGSHPFVPGFEEQVVGMSAGEEKDLDITFPENYHKELAGKPVVFHVKVKEVKEKVIPEQDDEFVKDVSEFETLDELKADIKSRFLKEKEDSIQSAFENAVLEKAAANMTADIPDCMIAEEVDRQMERFGYQLQMNGMSLKQYSEMMGGNLDALRDSMKGMAEAKVKQMVLLDAVAEAEKVEVTADDIAEEYKKLADSYKMDEEKVKQMLSEDDVKGNLESRKAAKLIVDAAVAVAPVEEKAEEAAESKDAE